jgi:hypothetical protein
VALTPLALAAHLVEARLRGPWAFLCWVVAAAVAGSDLRTPALAHTGLAAAAAAAAAVHALLAAAAVGPGRSPGWVQPVAGRCYSRFRSHSRRSSCCPTARSRPGRIRNRIAAAAAAGRTGCRSPPAGGPGAALGCSTAAAAAVAAGAVATANGHRTAGGRPWRGAGNAIVSIKAKPRTERVVGGANDVLRRLCADRARRRYKTAVGARLSVRPGAT